jgi:hypothetical protein
MKADAKFDYEPVDQKGADGAGEKYQNRDKVQITLTDGSEDPVNVRSDDEIRNSAG